VRPAGGIVEALARRRVALGFVTALVAIVLARPTWVSWRVGLVVAVGGEAIRVWAAGHLEKSREVTRSGPYRWTAHPLYLGSSVIALGVVLASRSLVLAIVASIYMGATIVAAIRTEEAFLRRAFGSTYDQYRRAEAEPMERPFSLERVVRNREYRAIVGLGVGFALLAVKAMVPI
jgi:protein-S-isoprenylcysteine O-methyltransferase Ste14